MGINWTEEQKKVISLRECNILVSAAAGSGKTAVLVQRILSKIMDKKHPIDIDRLLIMTFTRAAAGEMRERISAALENALYENPDDEHLQRQMSLIHTAQITTIHGFCAHLIRSYFHLIHLDPGYRIADDGEKKLLREDVLDELLEECYQQQNPDFLHFVECYTSGKSDKRIREIIVEVFDAAMSHPEPFFWLEECLKPYRIASVKELEEQEWMKSLWEKAACSLEEVKELIEKAQAICQQPSGPYMYEDALQKDLLLVEELEKYVELKSYTGMVEKLQKLPFASLSSKRDSSVDAGKKQEVKNIREKIKKFINELKKDYFSQSPEEVLQTLQISLPAMEMLVELVKKFHEKFSAKKREKNLLDFTDMEHFALQILTESGSEMSQAARELSEKYEEILVDEYQDSNLVQEMISRCVSGWVNQRKNIFMVGDVKQSIYRFRLAKPELFMEKYKTYSLEGGEEQRIDLHQNFRSRPEVLACVNYLFRQIMGEDLGGVAYDDAAALYPGKYFPEGQSEDFLKTEVLLVEKDTKELQSEAQIPDAKEMEALAIAHSIKKIVGKEKIVDKKTETYRPVEYGDIAILLRTSADWTETFQEILVSAGVPAYSVAKTGYFSALEIVTILDFLRVCDNPLQDIPLAGILHSSIAECSAGELARVRSIYPEGFLYKSICDYAEQELSGTDSEEVLLQKKLRKFLKLLEQCRNLAIYTPIHQLIQQILKLTGYGDYVKALPGGEQRSANLQMLVQKAIEYEKTSYRGLFHFVRYIENLQKYEVDFGEVSLQGNHGGAVQIMTIHKSKGLEFPIVYVAGLGKQFNFQDMNASLLIHPELGLGTDGILPEKRLKVPSLYKKMIRHQMLKDCLSEEMRILYVALTRAKEKLILSGSIEKIEKYLEDMKHYGSREEELLPIGMRMEGKTYWDYILPALVSHPCMREVYQKYEISDLAQRNRTDSGCPFEVSVFTAFDLTGEEVWHQAESQLKQEHLKNWDAQKVYHKNIHQELEKRFSYVYPYAYLKEIPVKVSVSELKKRRYQEEAEKEETLFYETEIEPVIPQFIAKEEKNVCPAAVRGTAYHCLLEALDYSQVDSAEAIEKQIGCLQKAGKLLENEAECISVKSIMKFLTSPLGERVRKAALTGNLYREQPFMILSDASELDKNWSYGESVLIQGMIDAYFIEEEEIVLVDYKTDRILRGQEKKLLERYRTQIEEYTKALERTLGRRVKERIIYSFSLNKAISVPSLEE